MTERSHPLFDEFSEGMKMYACEPQECPKDDDFHDIEKAIGRPLPADYLRFQREWGAAYIATPPDLWPRPEVGEVRPFWATRFALMIYGLGQDAPDYLNLPTVLEDFRSIAPDRTAWLPVMQFEYNAGEFVCFDESDNLVELQRDGDVWPIELSFDDYLVAETAELSKNLQRIINVGWDSPRDS